jgi:AmmeMemoRadiSam system protein A
MQKWRVGPAATLGLALAAAAVPARAPATGDTARAAGPPPAQGKEAAVIHEHRSGQWSPDLTDAEKTTLFAIAEDTLAWCTAGRQGEFSFAKYEITNRLRQPMATFVTLKKRGMLRGCIGSLAPEQPLYESIHANAVNAALNDYRFRPVAAGELPALEVHLSILSPIREIVSTDEFRIGEHGIIMEKGSHRAVYLPEVAVEQGWTKEETLSSLSEKAGAPPDAWKSGARFRVFSSVQLSK